ncbi:MAG: ferric reductase-like transmembrane domain-containing protein [Eggerthellaceae bacterium]|nr:ferric reductase-like transmembrane domain-containing protein [Eggerthellaceae bacterium]
MTVVLACFITVLTVLVLRTPLQHAPVVFYILAALLSVASALQLPAADMLAFSGPLEYVVKHGSVAFFLFAIIMYVGVLPETSRLRHYLMPVRGKLSIVASLIAAGHFVGYLAAFLAGFLSRTAPMVPRALAAFIFALVLFALFVPLAITSVTAIRDKMPAQRWKQLQQWAYVFFALLYVHMAIMLAPTALRGGDAAVRFACYTAVFVPYIVLFFARGKWRDVKLAA